MQNEEDVQFVNDEILADDIVVQNDFDNGITSQENFDDVIDGN